MRKKLNDQRPEFFKVFVPKFSSERMLIPPAFVRQFIPSSTTLIKNTCVSDSNGKSWNITIARLGKKLCFEAGWEEFCKAHSLEFGDFLLFRYNAFDTSFTVKIFGKNGCKKEFPGPSEIVEIESDNEEEKIRLVSKIVGESEKSRAKTMNERPLSCVPGKNLEFSMVLKGSQSFKHGMKIPQSVINKIKLKSEAVIRDEENKICPVKVFAIYDGRGCVTTGWSAFRKDKNLMSSDECVFKPVLCNKRKKLCKEFRVRVRVVRGVAKPTEAKKERSSYLT